MTMMMTIHKEMNNSQVTKAREGKSKNNTIHTDNKEVTINQTGDRKIIAIGRESKKEIEDKNIRGTPKERKKKITGRLR